MTALSFNIFGRTETDFLYSLLLSQKFNKSGGCSKFGKKSQFGVWNL
jgi:hypothetical protein